MSGGRMSGDRMSGGSRESPADRRKKTSGKASNGSELARIARALRGCEKI